ncbi:MAG: urease accessory protein UreF [Hyphomicrobiales bacterium]|nr:urease accessory protein UreF [Hyphomicrobiales bacterium]
MSDPIGDLLTLQAWLSPAFPVGGFTYSHGLEWAIEAGDVVDGPSLATWLADVLVHGAGRSDAILLVHAHRAARAGDVAGLVETIEFAAALQPSRERRLEATAQGAAFVRAVADTWSTPAFDGLVAAARETFAGEAPWTHAVAVGTAAGAAGLDEAEVAPAFAQAFAANVVSAGVRAIPLGQSEGLRILRSLVPVVRRIASDALSASLDDVGGAAVLADVASMRHETQYTRLYRS